MRQGSTYVKEKCRVCGREVRLRFVSDTQNLPPREGFQFRRVLHYTGRCDCGEGYTHEQEINSKTERV